MDGAKTVVVEVNKNLHVARGVNNIINISDIDYIVEEAARGNVHDMVKAMKNFVPEYKSMMSDFERIDKELEGERKATVAPPAPL